ncbi:hypothetical protein BGZ70_005109, partial [Mortierella alpina]
MFFVPMAVLHKNSIYFRTYRGSNIFVEGESRRTFDDRRTLKPRAFKPSVCKGLHSLYLYEKRLRVSGAFIATQDPSAVFTASSSIITANHALLRKLTWDWTGFLKRLDFRLAFYMTPAFEACTNLTDLALLGMRITNVEVLWSVLSPIAAQLTRLNLRGVSFDEYSVPIRETSQDSQVWLLPRVTELAISLSASEFVVRRPAHKSANDVLPIDDGCYLREERIIQACPQLCQLTVLLGTDYIPHRLRVTLLDARGLTRRFLHLRSFTSEIPYSDIKPFAKLLQGTGHLRLEELDIACFDDIYHIQEISRAIVQAHRNSLKRLCLRIEPEGTRADHFNRLRKLRKEVIIEESKDLGYHLRWLLEAMPELKCIGVKDQSHKRIASAVLDALVVGPAEQGSSGDVGDQARRDSFDGSSLCAWVCHGLESLSIQGFASFQFDSEGTARAHISERQLEHGWQQPESRANMLKQHTSVTAIFTADMEEDYVKSLQALLDHVSP